MAFVDDFKKFAFKGNLIDLAVGVVIGAAFQKIVTGVVGNVIMPVVGLVLPDGDWRQAAYVLRDSPDPAKVLKLTYGQLIGDALDFFIVAFVLFLVVGRLIPKLFHHQAHTEATSAPSKEQQLLTEIRDALRGQHGEPLAAEPEPTLDAPR